MIGIVATDISGGIGRCGSIPWYNREDMRRFKKITTNSIKNRKNVVIMGRKTWDSIGRKLDGRINVVLSKTLEDDKADYIARNKDDIYKYIEQQSNFIDKTFVIGGKCIYELFFEDINTIELTIINGDYDCDTKLDLGYIYSKFSVINIQPLNNYTNIKFIRN